MNCEGCGMTRVWTSTGADRFCTYSTNSLNSATFRRVRAKSQIARAHATIRTTHPMWLFAHPLPPSITSTSNCFVNHRTR
jgi:hypothetical protein